MGHLATSWAWQQPAKGNAKLVLLALADSANDEGVCWPGTKRVAAMVGLEDRAVRGHVGTLEEAGLLRREPRFRSDGSQASNLTVLNLGGGGAKRAGGGCTGVQGTEPKVEPVSSSSERESGRGREQEHGEFDGWIGDHEEVTGMAVPRAGTKARQHIASMFAARREEGYGLDDLKLATRGAFSDEFRRANGHFDPESVLRPTKVAKLIEAGRRNGNGQVHRDPLTGLAMDPDKYGDD